MSLFQFIIFFFKKEKYKVLTLICFTGIWGIFPVIDSILLKNLLDGLVDNKEEFEKKLYYFAIFWSLVYFIWLEACNWMARIYDVIYLKTLPSIKGHFIKIVSSYTMRHSKCFFEENQVGDISQKINIASHVYEEFYSLVCEKILTKVVFIASTVITLMVVNTFLGLIFILWCVMFFLIAALTSKTSKKLSTNFATSYNKIAGIVVDIFSNLSSVSIFSTYRREGKFLGSYISKAVNNDRVMQIYMTKIRYLFGLSTSLMMFFMVYSSLKLYSLELITLGDISLIIHLCMIVMDDIRDLIQEFSEVFEKIGIINNCRSLLANYRIADLDNATHINITKGEIEYKNVCFRYKKAYNLFHNKSLKIKGKEKIGLVGFSGSGKTTFTNLITRIYEIDSGGIFIDSQNIKNVTQASLRSSISVIPQHPSLFDRSIRDNIKYSSEDISDHVMIEAAKKVHLYDFIESLPDKYDTLCGEGGEFLSGGQRQRVIIARAIIKNAPILILDEATSNLDSITETHIQDSLRYLMQNKTVLVIAHRLSTLKDMDRILVFDNGKIVEDGTHDALISHHKLYHKLWLSQVKV